MLKLKNLRLKDFADYTCQVSVRNVCNIEDKSVTFRLTNATSKLFDSFLPMYLFINIQSAARWPDTFKVSAQTLKRNAKHNASLLVF